MKKALLIIDLQQGVCYGKQTLYQLDELVTRINHRVATFREKQEPIIWIQHEDEELIKNTANWQLHPQLSAEPADLYVGKTHANSFYHTELHDQLAALGIDTLEIWGGSNTVLC